MLDRRSLELATYCGQAVERGRAVVAEHHRVGAAQHSQQRAAAAAVLVCALDQARDLHQLNEHAAQPRQRRHRLERRERVVACLDLDRRQRLEQRRLARVRRADERDLRHALPAHRDRVAVHDLLADARCLDLRVHPLADVRVRPVPVAGQLREDLPELPDPLGVVLADEPPLDELHLRAMRHWHRDHLPFNSCGKARAQRSRCRGRGGASLSRRSLGRVMPRAADQPVLFEQAASQERSAALIVPRGYSTPPLTWEWCGRSGSPAARGSSRARLRRGPHSR